jgi:cysteine-rich repeat protein
VCDDGNTKNGDGCSADCGSDETCGNGRIDRAVAEVCDDGNTQKDDGCRPDCQLDEVLKKLHARSVPGMRRLAVMSNNENGAFQAAMLKWS